MADPRALRFSAALTSVLLVLALVAGPTAGLPLMAVQTFVFAFGGVLGLQAQPYVLLYRRFLSKKLGTSETAVPELPFQVDQGIGMVLTVSALLWGTLGVAMPYYIIGGIAAAMAAVHALTGLSVGGLMFHHGQRVSTQAMGQIGRLADAIDTRATARQAARANAAREAAEAEAAAAAAAAAATDSSTPATAPASAPAGVPASTAAEFYDYEADVDRPVVTTKAARDARRTNARVG